jgi:hypothetical protein
MPGAVYKARPDFTPPVALDPAATAVELANWHLEMDMPFAYTIFDKALATAILDSVGRPTKLLSNDFSSKPLDEMFHKHAALTGPDLQKLRASLYEPLLSSHFSWRQ